MSQSGREFFRLGAESYSSLARGGRKRRKCSRPVWCKFACGKVSSPRLYRLTLINSILISNQILNASIREVNDDAEAQIEVEIAEDIMMKEMQGYRIYHIEYSKVYTL